MEDLFLVLSCLVFFSPVIFCFILFLVIRIPWSMTQKSGHKILCGLFMFKHQKLLILVQISEAVGHAFG